MRLRLRLFSGLVKDHPKRPCCGLEHVVVRYGDDLLEIAEDFSCRVVSMSHFVPVGVDLGNSRIRVAYLNLQGHLEMLRDERDEVNIPNAVRFKGQDILVGKDALDDGLFFSPETAIWIKRELGSRTYSRAVHGQRLPPEVIQACVLRKVRVELLRQLAASPACVMGVPGYFDEVRRKAVINAGQIAGLRVIDVIDEPLAAALAYANAAGALRLESPGQEETILIFDLGSSALQVALAKLSSSECRILAKDYDVELGGYDFDVRLGEIVAEAMIAAGYPDPRADAVTWGRVYRSVVEAKHGLSSQNRVHFVYDYEQAHFELIITREQYEAATAPLLRRIERLLGRFLERTGVSRSQIDVVLPVGGAVRTPCVVQLLTRLMGRPIRFPINVDEAVARGAALYAAWKLEEDRRIETKEAVSEVVTTGSATPIRQGRITTFGNLLPYAVGIRHPQERDEETICLVSRATPLPFKVTRRLSLGRYDKSELTLVVAKNEVGSWESYGRLIVRGIPEVLSPQTFLELTVECQVNGRLGFHARLFPTAEVLRTEFVVPSALEIEAVERWQRTMETSLTWEGLNQTMASRAIETRDSRSRDTTDDSSPVGNAKPVLSREPAQQETELLTRRRHPRLAAAEAQGRWQPLEIALPPGMADKQSEPKPSPSPGEVYSIAEWPPVSPDQSKGTGPQCQEAACVKGLSIPPRPRVTREALLEGSPECSAPPTDTASVESAEHPLDMAVCLPSAGGQRDGLGQSASWVAMAEPTIQKTSPTSSRGSVRVLLPFGLTVPRWVIATLGFVISALLGLGLGYWIIVNFIPNTGLLKLW